MKKDPWTVLTTYQLKPGYRLTEYGDYGVKLKLKDFSNTDQVFWTTDKQSYVVCRSTVCPEMLQLVSINGIGEVRWTVELNDDRLMRGFTYWQRYDREAFFHFFEPRA